MADPEKTEETLCSDTFADTIIESSPYGILVLDGTLRICCVNMPVCRLVNSDNAAALIGRQVSGFLNAEIFMQVMNTGEGRKEACVYLPEYDRYVERNVVYDRGTGKLLCYIRDITDEVLAEQKKAELADRVIEKQMRVVQEIASLLGETAAETKIALTKLKESLNDE